MSDSSSSNILNWFSTIAKYIIIILLVGVVAYKLLITPLQLNIDFQALLSLILALFSVGLSAIFYFKATETSNAFYDNTFKYTKDIAELLVRIESGFGERLKHLDESYKGIQDRVMLGSSGEDIGKAQEKLRREEQEFQQQLQERDKLIDELATKAKLEGSQKDKFIDELKKRDTQLEIARQQIESLSRNVQILKEPIDPFLRNDMIQAVSEYLLRYIIRKLGIPVNKSVSTSFIQQRWIKNMDSMNDSFLNDMKLLGYVNKVGMLSQEGCEFIKQVIKDNKAEEDIPF